MRWIFAGFDEAGYGPKLGPLAVGWTAFAVEDPPPSGNVDLWERLGAAVRRRARGEEKSKLWVADSKEIKPRKDGLKHLELGVLAFRALLRPEPPTLGELLEELGQATAVYGDLPWYRGLEGLRLPAVAWSGEVSGRAARLREACAAAGVRYLGAGARVVDVPRYNALVRETQNKGQVLARQCVELLKALRERTHGPLAVTVDKHGGRAVYLRLLGAAFPLARIDIDEQGPERSRYRVDSPRGPVRVEFRTQAEEHSLPVALASMHCKYLREVFMSRLNAWFQERIPGLAPTAGYALDAKRFLAEVGPSLGGLGVAREVLVRAR
ncbi:MAG: hypothetical protein D6731_04800 [Planctomycetota bacterium]|nr:MAG: hypothetical protein D6731_04800 [Planctomycetota bacterium]